MLKINPQINRFGFQAKKSSQKAVKVLVLPRDVFIKEMVLGVGDGEVEPYICIPKLSQKQWEEYRSFDYQCYDKVYIPGHIPRKRSNHVFVNGRRVDLGDSLFVLFLRLTQQLKREGGGWVSRKDLWLERIITDVDRFQIYSNLRKALSSGLLEYNGPGKFIEGDGSKHYRISTHPDLITYEKRNLMRHPQRLIRKIAKTLP